MSGMGIVNHCPPLLAFLLWFLTLKEIQIFNYWSECDDFLKIVMDAWNDVYIGSAMLQLICKSKTLKKPLEHLEKRSMGMLPRKLMRQIRGLSKQNLCQSSCHNTTLYQKKTEAFQELNFGRQPS